MGTIIIIAVLIVIVAAAVISSKKGYRTKRVDGLIPFNKRSVIIM